MRRFKERLSWGIKRWHIMLLIIFGIMFVDLITKYLAETNIGAGEEINVIGNFLVFVFHINTGAAWSMFEGQTWFLIVTTLVSLFFFAWVIKTYNKKPKIVYSLTIAIGGTLGNFYQRLFNDGAVTDFISLRFGDYTFPTFNIADIAIVGGLIAAMVFAAIVEYGKDNN